MSGSLTQTEDLPMVELSLFLCTQGLCPRWNKVSSFTTPTYSFPGRQRCATSNSLLLLTCRFFLREAETQEFYPWHNVTPNCTSGTPTHFPAPCGRGTQLYQAPANPSVLLGCGRLGNTKRRRLVNSWCPVISRNLLVSHDSRPPRILSLPCSGLCVTFPFLHPSSRMPGSAHLCIPSPCNTRLVGIGVTFLIVRLPLSRESFIFSLPSPSHRSPSAFLVGSRPLLHPPVSLPTPSHPHPHPTQSQGTHRVHSRDYVRLRMLNSASCYLFMFVRDYNAQATLQQNTAHHSIA